MKLNRETSGQAPRRRMAPVTPALRRFAVLLSAAGFMLALGLLHATLRLLPDVQAQTGQTCSLDAQVAASPPIIAANEEVTITVDLSPRCSGAGVIHLAIVVDLSGSMVGAPLDKMKQRIHALLDLLLGSFGGSIEVGIVTFDTEARRVCEITGDRTLLNACIDAMTATLGDFGDVSGGIDAAQAMLVGASTRPDGRPNSANVMLLMGGGADTLGCGAMQQAAGLVKASGHLLLTQCVERGCDEQCMRQIATSPRYAFDETDSGDRQVQMVLRTIVGRAAVVGSRLILADWPAEGVRFEPDSAVPPAQPEGSGGRGFSWLDTTPSPAMSFSWRARTTRTGHVVLSAGPRVSLTDFGGQIHEFDLPPPAVAVITPAPGLATATPQVSGTATATGTPDLGAAPTPTSTRTSTPTSPSPSQRKVWLPWLVDSSD